MQRTAYIYNMKRKQPKYRIPRMAVLRALHNMQALKDAEKRRVTLPRLIDRLQQDGALQGLSAKEVIEELPITLASLADCKVPDELGGNSSWDGYINYRLDPPFNSVSIGLPGSWMWCRYYRLILRRMEIMDTTAGDGYKAATWRKWRREFVADMSSVDHFAFRCFDPLTDEEYERREEAGEL